MAKICFRKKSYFLEVSQIDIILYTFYSEFYADSDFMLIFYVYFNIFGDIDSESLDKITIMPFFGQASPGLSVLLRRYFVYIVKYLLVPIGAGFAEKLPYYNPIKQKKN